MNVCKPENLSYEAIEIYKRMQGISPPLLNKVFAPRQCNYDLRGNNFLERRRVKSVRYGTKSRSSLAPKIWEILPNEVYIYVYVYVYIYIYIYICNKC